MGITTKQNVFVCQPIPAEFKAKYEPAKREFVKIKKFWRLRLVINFVPKN